jgi:hypothetical protein
MGAASTRNFDAVDAVDTTGRIGVSGTGGNDVGDWLQSSSPNKSGPHERCSARCHEFDVRIDYKGFPLRKVLKRYTSVLKGFETQWRRLPFVNQSPECTLIYD